MELNEKPTVIVTNCPAIAFTLRVSAKARFLNIRYSKHLERSEHHQSEHKNIEDLRGDISAEHSCSTNGADSTTFWPVWT